MKIYHRDGPEVIEFDIPDPEEKLEEAIDEFAIKYFNAINQPLTQLALPCKAYNLLNQSNYNAKSKTGLIRNGVKILRLFKR